MTRFSDLGLAEKILVSVEAQGYDTPTPIQAQSIPVILEGRDLVGVAQTGSGKTASFVLPALQRASEGVQPKPKGCRTLILTPTRELAGQIGDAIRTYGSRLRPAVATIVGGMRPGPQVRAVAPGVDIIVATPGRLMDHMETGAVNVSGADLVILDEADQMLDLGFLPAVRKILSACAPGRQTVLFSATMPKAIRGLADDFLRDPAEVSVSVASRPVERIDQRVMHMEHPEKKGALIDFLTEEKVERGIVFTRTKRGADRVCRWLCQAGLVAEAIHGDKTQGKRDKVLNGFRHGRVHILVATDVAARGIDVEGVTHVVNYELPEVAEAYVHRIGRTARAGASGIALSLCCPDEIPYLRDIIMLTEMTPRLIGDGPSAEEVYLAKPAKKGGRRRGGGGQQAQGQGQKQAQGRGQGRPQGKPARGGGEQDGRPARKPRAEGAPRAAGGGEGRGPKGGDRRRGGGGETAPRRNGGGDAPARRRSGGPRRRRSGGGGGGE
ncbi:DEAD/DEAH box helicase [Rhodovulum sp. DZ06]|uniref:DEAD/DEAH box helicase n=1 Tax=Rhodovulum sp. DZ06 TaxID=3425126 RepID=UPI003D33DB08